MISKRKRAATIRFDRAAYAYDTAAIIQRTVGCRLAKQIGQLDLPNRPTVLEIGCGTGLFTSIALGYLDPSMWLVTDISPTMVTHCRGHFISDTRFLFACMDGEAPATAIGADFDLVCANLVVQWFDDLAEALKHLARSIKSGGWLAFTVLAAGTFAEWVEVHHKLGLVAGTPTYPDVASLVHQWPPDGVGTMTREVIHHTYPSAHAFVAALKTIGAHATERQPLPPGSLRRVLRAFGEGGPVVISYHVIYGMWQRNNSGDAR